MGRLNRSAPQPARAVCEHSRLDVGRIDALASFPYLLAGQAAGARKEASQPPADSYGSERFLTEASGRVAAHRKDAGEADKETSVGALAEKLSEKLSQLRYKLQPGWAHKKAWLWQVSPPEAPKGSADRRSRTKSPNLGHFYLQIPTYTLPISVILSSSFRKGSGFRPLFLYFSPTVQATLTHFNSVRGCLPIPTTHKRRFTDLFQQGGGCR